ncbi:hypothetical protein HYSC106933_10175 [Hydrogenibacillus schlegelii]
MEPAVLVVCWDRGGWEDPGLWAGGVTESLILAQDERWRRA